MLGSSEIMKRLYSKLKVDQVTNASLLEDGVFRVYKNTYWAVTEDDCILIYKNFHPQCSPIKNMVEMMVERNVEVPTRTLFLETVYLNLNISEIYLDHG